MELKIYKVRGEWRWRVKARNGKIVAASSESFKRRAGAENNLRRTVEYLTKLLPIGGGT